MEIKLNTMKCPSCGAILQYDDESSYITCEYCLTKLCLKSESEIKKEMEQKRAEKERELREKERQARREHELAEAAQRQAERERREEYERAVAYEEIARKERELKKFTKKWRIISGVLLFFGVIGFLTVSPLVMFLPFGIMALIHYHNTRTKLKSEMEGKISLPRLFNFMSLSCNEVRDALQSAGFLNVKTVPSSNAPANGGETKEQVSSVTINGKTVRTFSGYYSPSTEIKIMYDYAIRMPPLSRYKDSDYGLLVDALERAGFTNIKCVPLNDLVVGLMKRPGKIASISINGSELYSETSDWSVSTKWYLPNAKITISYHSLNR
ncbi:MAG: IBR domain-containing protein [Ruminococcus sp.]|nr:IBR domain-containing protein [Ruminococcus sp.]MCM1380792.1 IBR domain-containing protein [Muribaculaceae bacterium]MCM1478485.1 IBR domain-containing protein [Muribaculaceae bacterium]